MSDATVGGAWVCAAEAPAMPFMETPRDAFTASAGRGGKVHIRIQQRNGRKSITTVQGLDSDLDLKRILKSMKKAFNCNGSITEDREMGEVIQLQGDQRENVRTFLVEQEIYEGADEERIVVHGF